MNFCSNTNRLCEVDGENYIYFAADKKFYLSPKGSMVIWTVYDEPIDSLDEFGYSNLREGISEECFRFSRLKILSPPNKISELINWSRFIR